MPQPYGCAVKPNLYPFGAHLLPFVSPFLRPKHGATVLGFSPRLTTPSGLQLEGQAPSTVGRRILQDPGPLRVLQLVLPFRGAGDHPTNTSAWGASRDLGEKRDGFFPFETRKSSPNSKNKTPEVGQHKKKCQLFWIFEGSSQLPHCFFC